MTLPPTGITIAILIPFAVSAAVTALAIKVARRLRLFSHPVERSSHDIPTPQVGGVGICVAILMVFFTLPIFTHWEGPDLFCGTAYMMGMQLNEMAFPRGPLFLMLLLGFTVGLLDDIHHYSASKKIGALLLLAAIPLAWDISLDGFSFDEFSAWPIGAVLGGVLTVGWIFFFINAFNFMDGVNGQSGFFAINALGWWFAFLLLPSQDPAHLSALSDLAIALLLGLIGAILGFLVWNFPKARTFMGDSGSLPLGAILATIPLMLADRSLDLFIAYLMPLLLFIYDVIYTLLRRLSRRENLFIAHRSHLYQRLLIATDWSHTRLLAFHLPFYIISGLVGYFYYTNMLGRPIDDLPAATAPFFSPAFIRAATAVAAVSLLGLYTSLVLSIEKSKGKNGSLQSGVGKSNHLLSPKGANMNSPR